MIKKGMTVNHCRRQNAQKLLLTPIDDESEFITFTGVVDSTFIAPTAHCKRHSASLNNLIRSCRSRDLKYMSFWQIRCLISGTKNVLETKEIARGKTLLSSA